MDEHQVVEQAPDTSGRVPQRTAMTGVSALGGQNKQASALSVQETVFDYLRQMESVQEPTCFSTDDMSFVAAAGLISPDVAGTDPLEALHDPADRRARVLARLWDRLTELALRGAELKTRRLDSTDERGVVTDEWLHPAELCFSQTAAMHPARLPLVEELRAQIGDMRAIMLLFRRDRDAHPLLRTHNLTGGERLTLPELDAIIRYGETMSRELAVLSSSSVPGANRWFGIQDGHAAMIASFRDLTLVGIFRLDRLGRFVGLAESLEPIIRASE